MNTFSHFVALGCVVAIALGQLLFKKLGMLLSINKTIWSLQFIAVGFLAIAIYIGATIGWIWLLQSVQLSRVYPYFALSFAIVPLASALFFDEVLTWQYGAGILLIIAGVILIQTIHEPS